MSDTYLSQEHIECILDRPDPVTSMPFLQQVEKLYISCEHGRGKKLGLFFVMLNEVNVDPKSILHIGDNYTSDCTAAEQANILAMHYPKGDQALKNIIEMEWPKENSKDRRIQLDPQQGDFGLTALRSKLIFNNALDGKTSKDAFFWKYGATILGPVFTGFVHWVYKRCQELKQTQVFCLMREGRLYSNLIKQCASYHPEISLDPKELWASRQYMMRTCIFHGSFEELLAVFQTNPAVPFTVGSFCASLGLDANKIGKFSKYAHVTMDVETLAEDLAKYLSNNAALREVIVQNSHKCAGGF